MKRQELLDLYFLSARASLIDLAAFLDRVERAEGETDFRFIALKEAVVKLQCSEANRTVQVLLSLSDPTVEPVAQASGKGALGAWDGKKSLQFNASNS
jgi:hypothetical protein